MPKSNALKETAKKRAVYDGQESANSKPLARACPDVSQQCLEDPRWTRVFLPTLTHALYISEKPFNDWARDSDIFLQTVQTTFDLSFTNISYQLSLRDSIVQAVRFT